MAAQADAPPSLVDNRRLRALSRAEVENIIRNGMPNGMPPFGSLPEADLQAVTAFVRSFNSSAFDLEPAGDVAAGESFFFGKGTVRVVSYRARARAAGGPDLSNIGRQMTVPELTRALVEPDAAIAQGYATARVQLKDGRTLRGFVRNEGNHVLPLQTVDGRLVAVDKRAATITRETGSAMPPLKATPGRNARSDRVSEPARRHGATGARCTGATGRSAASGRCEVRMRQVRMTSRRF